MDDGGTFMHRTSRMIFCSLLMFCAFSAAAQSAPAPGGRRALVIGNAEYEIGPLVNPVNDARGVAKALENCGFSVTLLENAAKETMYRGVDDFSSSLATSDTALFFYAGHGAQVQDKNYLYPMGEAIRDEVGIKSLAIPVDYILGKIADASPVTMLVFLDACRTNPSFQSSRSGARGLAPPPRIETKNSLIVYATAPNSEALDGSGANSPFSEALIGLLPTPGMEIADLMRNLTSRVATATGEKQTPWVSLSMRDPFFFVDADAMYRKTADEAEKVAVELAALQARTASLSEALKTTQSAEERQKLDLEMRKVAADESLKALEAERLRKESIRLEEERSRQNAERELARARKIQEETNLARMKQLADEAKAAVQKLERETTDLNGYYRRYGELLREKKSSLEKSAFAWLAGLLDFDLYWDLRFDAVEKMVKEPWETAQEFQVRTSTVRGKLDAEKGAELADRRKEHEALVREMTKNLDQALASLKAEIESRTFTLRGAEISMKYASFDPDRKAWPIRVEIQRPSLRFSHDYRHSIAGAKDIATAYRAIDTLLNAGALAPEMDFGIRVDPEGKFIVRVKEFKVLDLTARNSPVMSDGGMYEPGAFIPTAKVWLTDPGMKILVQNAAGNASVLKPDQGSCFVDLTANPEIIVADGNRAKIDLIADGTYSAANVGYLPFIAAVTPVTLPGKKLHPPKPAMLPEFETKYMVKFHPENAIADFVVRLYMAYLIPPVAIPTWLGVGIGSALSNASGNTNTDALLISTSIGLLTSIVYSYFREPGVAFKKVPYDIPIPDAIQKNRIRLDAWESECEMIDLENAELLEDANRKVAEKNQEIEVVNRERGYVLFTPQGSGSGEPVKIPYSALVSTLPGSN